MGHRVLALLSRLRESELSCPTLAFSRVEGGVGAATRTPAVLHPRTGPCCPIPHGQRQADFLCSYRVSCSHCLLELPVCSELYKLYPSPQPLCKGIVNPHFAAEEAVVQRGEASCPGRVTSAGQNADNFYVLLNAMLYQNQSTIPNANPNTNPNANSALCA